jgi:hypothetical protein
MEVATCPETLARCLGKIAPAFELVGLEAGPMSEWLVRGLSSDTPTLTSVLMPVAALADDRSLSLG